MKAMRRTMEPAMAMLILAACGPPDHLHEGTGAKPPEIADELPTTAVTRWTDRTELFMEYPALVTDDTGRFAIHVTDLSDFTPLTSGEAVVVLRGENGVEQRFRGGVSRPGIYGVDVTPAGHGSFEMSLVVEAPGLQDAHALGSVTVHRTGDRVPPPVAEEQVDEISFLKEQQWTLEFGTETVAVRRLQSGLEVPGTVEPRAGGQAMLSAPVSGRIDPSSSVPVPGQRVAENSVLARIVPRSDEIRDAAGLRAALVEAEQRHELAVQERDRAARLVESRALPARRLSEAEAAVTASVAKLEAATQRMKRLDALTQSGHEEWDKDWFAVRAPFDGVVADVRFASGSSAEAGDFLLRLVDTDWVHVVASVPESRASALRILGAAELLVDGLSPIALGRPIAVGNIIDPATRTIAVRYELDNEQRRLAVGGGVRLRLFIGKAESLPAVPESALVNDEGRPVVFVQTGGESFQRRQVRVGSREGGYVHALSGIQPGERVVSRGAYLIRLAARSTQVPAHGHVH